MLACLVGAAGEPLTTLTVGRNQPGIECQIRVVLNAQHYSYYQVRSNIYYRKDGSDEVVDAVHTCELTRVLAKLSRYAIELHVHNRR